MRQPLERTLLVIINNVKIHIGKNRKPVFHHNPYLSPASQYVHISIELDFYAS